MRFKNLLQKLKKIDHKHILAITFVFIIFYVGAAALPTLAADTLNFFRQERTGLVADLRAFKTVIDDGYSEMLDFNRRGLQNRATYVNLNGLMARTMGQRYMNRIARLDNGQLAEPSPTLQDPEPSIFQMTRLFERQQRYGRDFVFVLVPHKNPHYVDVMPTGLHCYANADADNLVAGLRANGVPVIDLRDELVNDGIDFADAFIPTDHHWRAPIGFWAYVKVYEHLLSVGAIDPIDPRYTDINQFNIRVYEDWMLGSAGYRTGRFFGGISDFEIIYPKFETSLTVELPWYDFHEHGAFYDVMLDHSRNVEGLFNVGQFETFRYPNFMWIENENATNDIRILTILDSFGANSCSYYAFIARNNLLVDMRSFHGDFQELYYEFEPDVLIAFISPHSIGSPNTFFNFFHDD